MREPQYQGCWLFYCGAVAGALQALGLTVDVVDVAGYSGYTFLTNVTQGWTDPGSPTLHSGNVEQTILSANTSDTSPAPPLTTSGRACWKNQSRELSITSTTAVWD